MANLALNGAAPVLESGKYQRLYPWPPVNEETADKIRELYLSCEWSFNSKSEQKFENAYAAYHDAKYGIFMANGTVTLEAALEALGIGEGDEVIVPGLTWIATAMAVNYVGAKIVFADIDPATFTLDPAAFEAAITPRTKAVIPVHLYGSMADLEKIIEIARKHDIKVVEDCAHMQGGKWNGKGVGSWGDVGSFSFQQSKTLSGGESGICLTNDSKLAELIYRVKHIGYSRYDRQGQAGTPPPVGLTCHNYRGQAFSAVILSGQLPSLAEILECYQAFFDNLKNGIKDVTGVRLQEPGRLATRQGYYALGIVFDGPEWKDIPKGKIAEALSAEGMPVTATYGSVYKHLLFNLTSEKYIMPSNGCPVCEHISDRALVIMHFDMYYPEQGNDYATAIRKIAQHKKELL